MVVMSTFDVPSTYAGRAIDYRTLASAIAVFVGGYLVTMAVSGQLAFLLGGRSQVGGEVIAFLLAQALFAVAVVAGGLLLARASIGRRLVAVAIVVLVVVLTLVFLGARLNGSLGALGVPMSYTLANAHFMSVLGVGAAWLIVRSPGLGWLAVLLPAVLIPIPYGLAIAGIPGGASQLVLVVLSGVILAVIVLAGRPLRE